MGNVISFPSRRAGRDPQPLWREVVGEQLRNARHDRHERIADIARRAGVSPQYLSELERGVKDASSEVLAAVAGALALPIGELTGRITQRLSGPQAGGPTGPVCLAA